MTQQEILLQIQSIFQEALKRQNILLTETTTANDVDGWDSLTNMIIISKIENHFGIKLNFRKIVKLKNVGDLCNAVLTEIS